MSGDGAPGTGPANGPRWSSSSEPGRESSDESGRESSDESGRESSDEPTGESPTASPADEDAAETGWHATPVDALDSDPDGLGERAVERRRERYGPNELVEESGRSPLWILVAQFTSPLILLWSSRRWRRSPSGTRWLTNPWLAFTVLTSFVLHLTVLYTPLRRYFDTVPLTVGDWLLLGGLLVVGIPALLVVGWLVGRFEGSSGYRSVPGPASASTEK